MGFADGKGHHPLQKCCERGQRVTYPGILAISPAEHRGGKEVRARDVFVEAADFELRSPVAEEFGAHS